MVRCGAAAERSRHGTDTAATPTYDGHVEHSPSLAEPRREHWLRRHEPVWLGPCAWYASAFWLPPAVVRLALIVGVLASSRVLGLAYAIIGMVFLLLPARPIPEPTPRRALIAALSLVAFTGSVLALWGWGAGRGSGWVALGLLVVAIATLAEQCERVPLAALIAVAVALLGVTGVLALSRGAAAVGDTTVRPTAVGFAGDFVLASRAVGSVTIDLRALDADGVPESFGTRRSASVGVGDIVVLVPSSVSVSIDADVRRGAVRGPLTTQAVPESAPTRQVDLNLHVGIGDVVVRPVR